MASSGTTVTAAIEAMTEAMMTSMLSSGRSAAAGKLQHVLATQDEVGDDVIVYPVGDYVT